MPRFHPVRLFFLEQADRVKTRTTSTNNQRLTSGSQAALSVQLSVIQ